MSQRRKRRRKRESRQRHEIRSLARSGPTDAVLQGDDEWLSLTWLVGAQREPRDGGSTAPPATGPRTTPSVREAPKVERLAYTRQQAAEALGVSVSTVDRRLIPSVDTVKTPWGQRLIPVDELERFLREHVQPARGRRPRGSAGRPRTLPRDVVERIRLEYARGRSLTDIARTLTNERVPTAHGGRRWWPSTVRAIVIRSTSD